MWVSVGLLNKASKKSWTSVGLLVTCGSVWVIVGQEAIVVRKEGSVGLLVNCGSFSQLWVIVGLLGKCGSFREMWVSVGQEAIVVRKEGSVGLLVNCGSVWVRRG